jgi:hypothetical protein
MACWMLATGILCIGRSAATRWEQVRRVIATQAHRQEHLREPLQIDKIHKYLGKDAWHVIWAEPQDSETGVFLIAAEDDQLRYVALWGGVAFPEDEARIFDWFVSKAPGAGNRLVPGPPRLVDELCGGG